MKLTELFLAELDREVPRSRRALEQVPADKRDWKPHDKSMPFGYLADMVATIPSWLAMIVKQDELDIAPKEGQQFRPPQSKTSQEFVAALESAADQARTALRSVDDDFLQTRWRLLVAGNVVANMPRHEMLRETINHWAHHRGQMTVYLRLMGARVPAIYGPSADDTTFA
jgi:uncharacterized damage-inducible protein DinB